MDLAGLFCRAILTACRASLCSFGHYFGALCLAGLCHFFGEFSFTFWRRLWSDLQALSWSFILHILDCVVSFCWLVVYVICFAGHLRGTIWVEVCSNFEQLVHSYGMYSLHIFSHIIHQEHGLFWWQSCTCHVHIGRKHGFGLMLPYLLWNMDYWS